MARTPDRIIGHVEVEIIARHGDTDHSIGTVEVPISLNAAAVKREVQAAFAGQAEVTGPAADPEETPDEQQ